jgi:hypothetical protein
MFVSKKRYVLMSIPRNAVGFVEKEAALEQVFLQIF